MNGYTYDMLKKDIELLNNKYSFIQITSIGKSLVGRELPLIKIGNGQKSILYVGTHHGMEWITSLLLMKYAEEYCKMISEKNKISGIDSDILFEKRTLFIVPMLNPDGVELQINGFDRLNPLSDRLFEMSKGDFSHWQANGRGVDLNHNYNAGFDEYKKIEVSIGIHSGAPTRFSGAYPESEPETSSLCSFIRTVDISMLMALHTQGEEIYADYNGYVPPNGMKIAARMAKLSGYKIAKPDLIASYGGLKDWFINEFNRVGFTVECGLGTNPLPLETSQIIFRQIKRMLLNSILFI